MGQKQDVFISYAHLDNAVDIPGRHPWIDDFHQALSVRVAQLLGHPINIWRDPKLSGNDDFGAEITDQLPLSSLLVMVLSPRYVLSPWCTKEFRTFFQICQSSGGISIGNKKRIFKVVKTPLVNVNPPDDLQSFSSEVLGYEFFQTDPQSNRFHEIAPDTMRDEYLKHLDDLSQDIASLLASMANPVVSPSKPTIYLAETAFDLKEQRDSVRRDLERRGYTVVPQKPLPTDTDQLTAFVEDQLAQAALAINMVGARYGLVPDGANTSIVETQISLAKERMQKSSLVHLVWIPPGIETSDARTQDFIQRLRADNSWGPNADLVERPLESLKTVIDDRLKEIEDAAKKSSAPPPPAPTQHQGPAHIYLICDPQDQPNLKPFRTFLFDSGFEVDLPIFDSNVTDTDRLTEHQKTLQTCAAVVIFQGAASEIFLREKLRDVQDAAASRKSPFLAKAICLAPPVTEGKKDFLTREALVIDQTTGFAPEAWAKFLFALKPISQAATA